METENKHRQPGRVGRFTVHAPDDYRPRHRAHLCTEVCDPGNCEVQHHLTCYPCDSARTDQ